MRRVALLLLLVLAAWPAGAARTSWSPASPAPPPSAPSTAASCGATTTPPRSAYFLMQRLHGVTSRLLVDPRSVPFDVDLGPDADGKPVAAYSRCRRDPGRRDPRTGNILAQLPAWSTGRGCDVYMFSFETGKEVRVGGVSSRGASEFLPTVWTDRIAFARVFERKRGRAGKRTYLYVRPNALFAKQGPRGGTQRVPAGYRTHDRLCRPGRPPRCDVRLIEPGPTSLDLATRRLAFGWDSYRFGPTRRCSWTSCAHGAYGSASPRPRGIGRASRRASCSRRSSTSRCGSPRLALRRHDGHVAAGTPSWTARARRPAFRPFRAT